MDSFFKSFFFLSTQIFNAYLPCLLVHKTGGKGLFHVYLEFEAII